MSCDRHTSAIVDHACGAEIAAEAAAHLNGCAACRRLFDEQRRLLQDLDGRQLALAIEPSPRFVPAVLARVERSTLRVRRPCWWGGAAAAAVLVLVALGSWRPEERQDANRQAARVPSEVSSAAVVDHRPSQVTPSTSPEATPRQADARRRVARPQGVADHASPLEAEVVVPPTESRALARYLALVRRGALDASTLASSDGTGVAAPTELVIVPLAVDTLAVTDVQAGIGPVSRREPGTR